MTKPSVNIIYNDMHVDAIYIQRHCLCWRQMKSQMVCLVFERDDACAFLTPTTIIKRISPFRIQFSVTLHVLGISSASHTIPTVLIHFEWIKNHCHINMWWNGLYDCIIKWKATLHTEFCFILNLKNLIVPNVVEYQAGELNISRHSCMWKQKLEKEYSTHGWKVECNKLPTYREFDSIWFVTISAFRFSVALTLTPHTQNHKRSSTGPQFGLTAANT